VQKIGAQQGRRPALKRPLRPPCWAPKVLPIVLMIAQRLHSLPAALATRLKQAASCIGQFAADTGASGPRTPV